MTIRGLCARGAVLVVATCACFESGPASAQTSNDPAARAIAQRVVDPDGYVCDAARLNIGRGTIVASIDYSGRHFCNEVIRVQPGPRPRVLQRFDVWELDDVAAAIHDVTPKSAHLVLPVPLSLYEGGPECVAVVPIVYTCSPGTCIDTSQSSRSFYEQELRRIRAKLQVLTGNPELARGSEPDCLTMSAEKIERIMGTNPKAGFATAEQWMRSPDVTLRAKAVSVFRDINDAASRERLEVLARDPVERVAVFAKGALETARQRR